MGMLYVDGKELFCIVLMLLQTVIATKHILDLLRLDRALCGREAVLVTA